MPKLSTASALLAAGAAIGAPAMTYVGYVNLQSTFPGTPDSGNINVTGTVMGYELRTDPNGLNNGGHSPGVKLGGPTSLEGIASTRQGLSNNKGVDVYTAGAPRLSVTNGGNVGIGTRNPGNKLEVIGNIYSTGSITANNLPRIKMVRDTSLLSCPGDSPTTTYTRNSMQFSLSSPGYLKLHAEYVHLMAPDQQLTLGVRVNGTSNHFGSATYPALGQAFSAITTDVRETVVQVPAGVTTVDLYVSPTTTGVFNSLFIYRTVLIAEYFPETL